MERSTQSEPNLARPSAASVGSLPDYKSMFSQSRTSITREMSGAGLENIRVHKSPPYNLRWIRGHSYKVGVINLNHKGSTIMFYAAANCGVLFNWTTRQMRILQGHKHMVTGIAADSVGKWLVTADSGPENIINIWDTQDLFPQKTLFSPHGLNKIAKIALSTDAKYLLTVAYESEAISVFWWIWSMGWDSPHATITIPMHRDTVLSIGFNPFLSEQFIVLTKTNITIGISRRIVVIERGLPKVTDDYELKVWQPEKFISTDHGQYTSYTFVENTCQILVGTSRGSIVVYGYTMEYNDKKEVQASDYNNLKFIKVLKVEKKRINVIESVDNVIVTANTIGQMHFYDDQLKLLYWVYHWPTADIRSLGFNKTPRSYKIFDPLCKTACPCWEKVKMQVDPNTGLKVQKLLKMKIPVDATATGKPFIVRDFLVGTVNGGVSFVDFVMEKQNPVMRTRSAPTLSISAHPEKSFICIAYADGMVELYNFTKHKLKERLDLKKHFSIRVPPRDDSINGDYEIIVPKIFATCVQYSPSGLHLACGLNNGRLIFLDPSSIEIITPKALSDTTYAIKFISFSVDSLTLAMADAGKTVLVYKYDCNVLQWIFIGKHRSHYKEITVLMFLPEKNPDGNYKLLSLAKDRMMVEYDIGASGDEYLEILSLDRMEQTAMPLAGIPWPTPDELDPNEYRADVPLILVACNEYKYKIINYNTAMTLSTVLGPRYESPVSKMCLVRKEDHEEKLSYLVFATKDVIGLQKLPLTGNPWKHVGMLGHPNKVQDLCFRADISSLFTIGDRDCTMMQWAANHRKHLPEINSGKSGDTAVSRAKSVEVSSKTGGVDLNPYYCLIEDSRPGWLFQEIRDLFYYIQILCQGTFSPAMRRVKDFIPIDSLPDLMRALGFFPTDYEVENLLVEAKYKVYRREPATEIDFEEFVKLYLNHRPVFGENFKRIRSAFRTFASVDKRGYYIAREDFIDMLTTTGECFSRELAWYLLAILSGQSFEDRAAMVEEDFSFLPEEITFSDFVNEIMGMQEMDNVSERMSTTDIMSLGSVQSCHTPDSADSAD